MYTHILIPTDGSELAGKAVQHGAALAKRIAAKVTVLTVLEPAMITADTDLRESRKAHMSGNSCRCRKANGGRCVRDDPGRA